MRQHPTIDPLIAEHRQQTEAALARLRTDDSLDDREKGRQITEVIAAANARMVALVGQRAAEPGYDEIADREPFDISRRLVIQRTMARPRDIRWG